jgi:hypothetical protein
MTKLLAILIIGFVSCQQLEKTQDSPPFKADVVDTGSTSGTPVAQKKYSLDEIYQRYVSEDLLAYLEKTHPAWSVPNQHLWYPQLFNSYKTDSTLVNYVNGDFDCNGKKDHAMILDNGLNRLTTVAFLAEAGGFKTVELTQLSPLEGNKIDFVLSVYKPGRYNITDPDLDPSDPKVVNFKCTGVGIGVFKELYEESDDVFYWDRNQLRSCVIAK